MTTSSALAVRIGLCLAALVSPATGMSEIVPWLHGEAFAQSAGDSEKEAFDEAKALGTIDAWDAFLSNFPTGFHADLARAYVKKLSEEVPAPPPSQPATPAVQADDDFPAVAGSWGGIVRDGPGKGHRQIDSLKEGEPVTLMARSDVIEDGFPWFKIAYRDGRIGYQWGGILCSTGAERPDVFKTCTAAPETEAESREDPRNAPGCPPGTRPVPETDNCVRITSGTTKSACGKGQIKVDGKCMTRDQAAGYCGPGFHAEGGKCLRGFVARKAPRPSTHGCPPGMAWSAAEGCHEDD
jgi:hypothetical protein